ncbi:MAG: hypothetical protein RLZZ338_3056 [Cyanobacteriota bacterium]|jgi:hypothetical protein
MDFASSRELRRLHSQDYAIDISSTSDQWQANATLQLFMEMSNIRCLRAYPLNCLV